LSASAEQSRVVELLILKLAPHFLMFCPLNPFVNVVMRSLEAKLGVFQLVFFAVAAIRFDPSSTRWWFDTVWYVTLFPDL